MLLNTNYCLRCGGYRGVGLPSTTNAKICECQYESPAVPAARRGWICPLCGAVLSPDVQTCPGDHRQVVPVSEVSKYQATLRALREAGDGLVGALEAILEDDGYSRKNEAITAWYKAQGV